MGHDGREGIICKVKHHDSDEDLCVRRHPEGGYAILIKHGGGRELCQLTIDEASGALIARQNARGTVTGETRWFFEEV